MKIRFCVILYLIGGEEMKKNFSFIASIFEIVVGIFAIVAFITLAINGESLLKWAIALILAILLIGIGINGIIKFCK